MKSLEVLKNDLYGPYSNEVVAAKEQILLDLEKYSTIVRETCRGYLAQIGLLPGDTNPTGISPYISFWLAPAFGMENAAVPESLCRAALYISECDRILDNFEDREFSNPNLLVVRDVFMNEYHDILSSLFYRESQFWEKYQRYLAEYIESCIWEQNMMISAEDPLSESSLKYIGNRGGFLKPVVTAIALAAGRPEDVTSLEEMMQHLFVAMNVYDDFVDWEDDLERRTITTFLCSAMKWGGVDALDKLSVKDVRTFVFVSSELNRLFEISIKHIWEAQESIKELQCPYMKAYIDIFATAYAAHAAVLEKTREDSIRTFARRILE